MAGTLFIVATPIGNLEDLTFRALRTLKDVDLIAAEDTRRTAKLLAHYEIRKSLTSYREHNEAREGPRLVARLQQGESVALVTDAGTPGIADPGARLVRAARAAGIAVVPIPGASAVAAALSVAGLDFDEFTFMGFPPGSGSRRAAWFDALAREPRPVVLFEAPHRVRRTVRELLNISNNLIIALRELSKINEHYIECTNSEAVSEFPERGEYVIIVRPSAVPTQEHIKDPDSAAAIVQALRSAGLSRELALEFAARGFGVNSRTVKKAIKTSESYGKQPKT